MRYRNLWSCLVLFTLLSVFVTLVVAEDAPAWQAFVAAKQDWSVPGDDKEDPLFKLRVEYLTPEGKYDVATGSATNIGNDELLTADHCVNIGAYREVFIRTNDGWIQCDIVSADDDYDIALLHARTHLPAAPIVLDANEHTAGIAHVYGCPWGGAKQRFDGLLRDPSTKGYIQAPMLDCLQVAPGCSGGAVVFEHKLIGIQQAIKTKGDGNPTGHCYYLSSKTILEWLKGVHKDLEKKSGDKGPAQPKVSK